MMRIKVSGLDEIQKELRQLESKERWDSMMKAAAHQMKRTAKELCPVDTGQLRDSIYVRRKGKLEYEIGFTIYYGIYNEYGWYAIESMVGDEQNPIHYKGGYRPFLRPAVWRTIQEFPELLAKYFDIL